MCIDNYAFSLVKLPGSGGQSMYMPVAQVASLFFLFFFFSSTRSGCGRKLVYFVFMLNGLVVDSKNF